MIAFTVKIGIVYGVRSLAEHGANLGWTGPLNDYKPLLIMAIFHNDIEIISALLKFPTKIDLDTTDNDG